MSNQILDTNVRIRHWRKSLSGSLKEKVPADAERWARRLVDFQGSDAIVTPVAIEFVCGVTDPHEMTLARAYLGVFTIIDGGSITSEDWSEARRLAERIPPNSSRRDLGDCLVKAIADRLRHLVFTFDEGMRRTKSTKLKQPGHTSAKRRRKKT